MSALGSAASKKRRDKAREAVTRRAVTQEQKRNADLKVTARAIEAHAGTLTPAEEARRMLRAESFKQQWMLEHGRDGDHTEFMAAIARIVRGFPAKGRVATQPRNKIRGIRGGRGRW